VTAPILVGTCNWADHESFYPEELERGRRQRDKLSFYARYFPIVEIDTTFYGIPKPPVVAGWVERTPDDFRFNIKAYRSLTGHEREDGKPRPPTHEEERDFLAALEPLRDSGKLTAVHYQFPPWFTNRPSARELLLAARERHPDDIVAIEFRHRSWFEGGAWPDTEELLRELDCVFVGVDCPHIRVAGAWRIEEVVPRKARNGAAPVVGESTRRHVRIEHGPRITGHDHVRRAGHELPVHPHRRPATHPSGDPARSVGQPGL
jgi:uncharacterized protein YecE (DUF72 family)